MVSTTQLYMINRVSSILGTQILRIKTCRKASSSEQLLGVVVVDWLTDLTVHFALGFDFCTMLICVDDVGVVIFDQAIL